MNLKPTSFGTHQPHDEVAQYEYLGKLLFTANRKEIDEENTKYIIKRNGNNSIHEIKTGNCFFTWETHSTTENNEEESLKLAGVDLTIWKAGTESGEWVVKAVYKPVIEK
ncbi:hypothetical protein [endosymbiont GvMRE of Glomus versiforme]|uniref:hypothetical protein n=1 Tax=endosymbiont GvMRE of Glomus versiforme TaxID=2039283 RepID=UPI000EDCFE98|nr:hypothetical protein [endosymbiont GvMRE of Glomus versiforme]RHZ37642.1 hypothetical protein GvMRE_I1g517 [endosymbiont GvMRE of Glomus versiforme]